jgi:hypothetical protein
MLGQGIDLNRKFGKHKVCGGLIYTPVPVVACALSAPVYVRIVPVPVPAHARSHPSLMATHPRPDTRPLCSVFVCFKSHLRLVAMVTPAAAFVQRVCARYHASV